MNNIEHLVHPGVLRNLDKAKATLELAKIAVELDPVDSRAHLCCGWSYMFALREAEAAPHMQLACELNDNDPWTLLSSAHYCAFCGSIEQAQLRASQSLALSLAPSRLEWGYHCIIRCLCGDYAGAIEACDRAYNVIQTLPAWRAAALFELGQPELAREEAQRFLNGIRSFWVGSDCADRRGHHTLAPAGAPHQHQGAVGNPAPQLARRRVSGRRHCAIVLVTRPLVDFRRRR